MVSPLTRRQFLGAAGVVVGAGDALAAPPIRLQILVASSSSLQNISLSDLRQLYRGRMRSLAGQAAVPFNHPPRAPDRVIFDNVVLGMGPDEVGRYWVDQKIRGAGSPPRTVDSVGMLLRVVGHLPGAIGYVREGYSAPDVRVIAVDGKLPNDPAYPISAK